MDRFSLNLEDGRLKLFDSQLEKQNPISVDFKEMYSQLSRPGTPIKRDLLYRALGLTKNPNLKVIDGTLGLAKDAFKIAYWGVEVKAFEKNETVFSLVESAIKADMKEPKVNEVLSRLKICHADILEPANDISGYDVIYLDPMFMTVDKKSRAKKGMQALRELVGSLDSGFDFVSQILRNNKQRLVVKRPLKGEQLYTGVSYDIKGKLIRYDVYNER